MKFFNTTGPVVKDKHYYVPIMARLNIEEVLSFIEQEKYFVLHAPRQSGKTTSLLTLMNLLNESGRFKCLYVNVEGAQTARENVKEAMESIISELAISENIYLKDNIIAHHAAKGFISAYTSLANILTKWAQDSHLPTVLLIDEIDSLVGDSLISVLRQLRSRFVARPKDFPQSVILCGVRDVRDYRIFSSSQKEIITGGSCFNIKAKSIRIGDFTEDDVRMLFLQHTEETGQEFADDAITLAYNLTNGQPWLINALAYEACFELPVGKEKSNPITVEIMNQAKDNLIRSRATHLDQLADKLKEDRVRNIIEPMLAGGDFGELSQDDIQYSIDLGLLRASPNGLIVANKIYQEVIPRELSSVTQTRIESKVDRFEFITTSGDLNIEKLLDYFVVFFRENSESWIERFDYKEAGPHLILMAFLQRVINHGGRLSREYGLGRQRADLLIEWNHDKYVIELKIKYKSLEKTMEDGLDQIHQYMDRVQCENGNLLIFDKSENMSWEEKIFKEKREFKGKRIMVWGM